MQVSFVRFIFHFDHIAETSKRGTTNKRARIQHKVAESRKKTKKAAKKDPQWKSSVYNTICVATCER